MHKLNLYCPFPTGIDDWFKMWPQRITKALFRDPWLILPSLLIWELWKEHNRRIFQDKSMDAGVLYQNIELLLIELTNEVAKGKTLKKTYIQDGIADRNSPFQTSQYPLSLEAIPVTPRLSTDPQFSGMLQIVVGSR